MREKTCRKQTQWEELANTMSHALGALLALIGGGILLYRSGGSGNAVAVASIAVYAGSLFILYMVSATYHGVRMPRVKAALRVLDHCSIFLLILGTYVPMALLVVGGRSGWMLCLVNGLLALIGIVLNIVDLRRFEKGSVVLYVLMGWLVMLVIDDVVAMLPATGLALLVGGGVAYTVGIIFYKSSRLYAHFIWHLFVLLGSILHYGCVAMYCL